MPLPVLISLLIIPALCCWALASLAIYFIFKPTLPVRFAGLSIQGFVPTMWQTFQPTLAAAAAGFFTGGDHLIKNETSAGMVASLRPEIEKHIDIFLQEKLKEAFPLMHQLMGEKTLGKFREIFLQEVESLLPMILQKAAGSAAAGQAIAELIKEKASIALPASLKKKFIAVAGKQLLYFKVLSACVGFTAGIFQILIVLLLR